MFKRVEVQTKICLACDIPSAEVDSFGKEMIDEEPSFIYQYMGVVPIPILGQGDDLIGVAEVEHKTKQLNSFVNVKTADKNLQFGPEKCKTMMVSKKKIPSFHKPELEVDAWELKHEPNGIMDEKHVGKSPLCIWAKCFLKMAAI